MQIRLNTDILKSGIFSAPRIPDKRFFNCIHAGKLYGKFEKQKKTFSHLFKVCHAVPGHFRVVTSHSCHFTEESVAILIQQDEQESLTKKPDTSQRNLDRNIPGGQGPTSMFMAAHLEEPLRFQTNENVARSGN
ncbi:Uncharacterised protein at_DN2668 [Pycnogonum litorale]